MDQLLNEIVTEQSLEALMNEFDPIELASLESSIRKDLEELNNSIRIRRVLTDISPEGLSIESYKGKIEVAFECFGIDHLLGAILPSLENASEEDYTTEAEAKKAGIIAAVIATIKRLIASLVDKFKSLFGKKKTVVAVLLKQQDAAEKAARDAGNDFSKVAEKAPESHPSSPYTPKGPAMLRLGYAEGHTVKLGFMGYTFDEVIAGAAKIVPFAKTYVDAIDAAAQKCASMPREEVVGKHSQIQNLITDFYAELKFNTGTIIDADFYSGGPRVRVIKGMAGNKELEVRNLQQVPMDKLLHARRDLIGVVAYDTNKLQRFQNVMAGVRRQFDIELAAREKVAQSFGPVSGWNDANRAEYQKADGIMRVEEAMLGFLSGVLHTPTDDIIKPALGEIDRCLGLRGALGV